MKLVITLVPLLWLGFSAQAQFSRTFPPQEPQTGKASIEGSVLDAITREPVKKASVSLNGRTSLFATTDASGHFAFKNLPAGSYVINVRSDKYPQAQEAIDTNQQLSLSLEADEQKQDLRFELIPGASVRGRVLDEDGNPMRCNVAAMQFRYTVNGPLLQHTGSAESDDKGEYRISNLARGKYHIYARCNQTVLLPHAFLPRTAGIEIPRLAYAPLFYPDAPDLVRAAKVAATPGADIAGIDFHMAPAHGITVRGHVASAQDRNIQLTIAPKDPVVRDLSSHGARVNPSTGEFQIPNVLPGSYELVATVSADGRSYFGKASLEVGAVALEPIELDLAAAPAVSGSVTIESDTKVPMSNLRVMINPLQGTFMMAPLPPAELQSDGTFIFNSVPPGHFRLNLNGAPGYVKSITQGDREVSAWNLDIGSAGAQLKIVVGTKFATIEAGLAAPSSGTETVSAIVWPVAGDPAFQQNIGVVSQSPSSISVPPGKYYVCAFASAQPWALLQNFALRKALESRCETVDAPEGGKARVQLSVIPASDLKQMLEKLDQ
jgi:Carboxypeptidase regulatory-like domain